MTTFTELPVGSPATITLYPNQRLSKINRNIYSGFTEHMGRCIYGGLYDPTNPNKNLVTADGFRKDVLDTLRPLNIPVVRYPGGNFCATYHWLDGVGPRNQRPSRPELAWEGEESNQFGTDEFMVWCKELGTEPYLCLNFGTGTLDEALAWLEYCNSDKNTYYANLRRKNGHDAPYHVKYWALGNEMWGDWQIGQLTQEAYAERAMQWAKALKLLDPSIQLILCGKEGATSWDYHVLKQAMQPAGMSDLGEQRHPLIDMHSIHLYTASEDHYENATAPLAAERSIEVASALIDLARIENKVPPQQPRPPICFDEWNVWMPTRAVGSKGAEETYTLSDALAVAVWLNVFVRQSKDVGMACLAQTVNVISPLMTTESGVITQTIWWPYELFCKYISGSTVACHVAAAGCYDGPTKPAWIRGLGKKMPWLDVSASVDDEDCTSLCVVNFHKEQDIEAEIQGIGSKKPAQVFTITGKDVGVTNMKGTQEVGVEESAWEGQDKYTFPKHSFTMLRWQK